MFELDPIPVKIQKRLFEKINALKDHNTKSINSLNTNELTFKDIATRSPFIRMTSGQINPVVLMNGKLNEDGSSLNGYEEVYGPRTYQTYSQEIQNYSADLYNAGDFSVYSESQLETIIEAGGVKKRINNKFKRPMPGVKSIDVQFKGGVRALREATISWTCWDWQELEYLMPHFLAHGKTVMIEWGWIYGNKPLKIDNFIDFTDSGQNIRIKADAFTNYRNTVIKNNGDFDLMVGVIKNFEFTTRTDGGFDCQTILTSVGSSIIDSLQPNKTVLDPGLTYNLSVNDDTINVLNKLDKATGKTGTEKPEDRGDINSLVDLDTNITLKEFIRNIDRYIAQELSKKPDKKQFFKDGNDTRQINYDENKFLCKVGSTSALNQGIVGKGDVWVRWGWFEDNVLNKFLALTSKASGVQGEPYDPIITQFRSIERVQTTQGDDTKKYESVRIKNHNDLRTVNINHYILPGQFSPVDKQNIDVGEGKPIKIKGDSDYIRKLASICNSNFSIFAASPSIEYQDVSVLRSFVGDEDVTDFVGPLLGTVEEKKVEVQKKVVRSKYGYLRNILVNTTVLKDAFGVSDNLTTEPINVIECIQNIFYYLNQELNFWNFNIESDSVETNRVKIVDKQITAHNFDIPTRQQKSILNENGDVTLLDNENSNKKPGVFFFPVWQTDSIVKSQNVSAQLPNAMILTAMYGANMDQLKDFNNPGGILSEKEGVALGGLWNEFGDTRNENLDIAFRNHPDTGVPHGSDIDDTNIPLRVLAGGNRDGIRDFIKNNSETLEETFENRETELKEKLKINYEEDAIKARYDSNIPPPFIDRIENKRDLFEILKYERTQLGEVDIEKLYGSVYEDSGRMKQSFISSVSYLTTQQGIFSQIETPLLIPFDLELEIDGIGGIYPGNSFHSTYLPIRYQDTVVFQAFDVNHKLDSTGWTTTLVGKMRASLGSVFERYKTLEELYKDQIKNFKVAARIAQDERNNKGYELDSTGMRNKRQGGMSGRLL